MSNSTLQVIPLQTQVTIKLSEYKGIITAINIRKGRIVYEVSHYENGSYKELYLEEYQFDVDGKIERGKIGFDK